jgi:hypothetical protein
LLSQPKPTPRIPTSEDDEVEDNGVKKEEDNNVEDNYIEEEDKKDNN